MTRISTHSGNQTCYGITSAAGDLIFDPPNFYVAATGAWTTRYSSPKTVIVPSGTLNAATIWVYDGVVSYNRANGVYSFWHSTL